MSLARVEIIAISGAVLAGVFVLWKAAGVAKSVATQAGAAIDTAVAAPVLGIGDTFGIPRTDAGMCARAIAEGRTLDASFACPASDFLKYIVAPPMTIPGVMPDPRPAAIGSTPDECAKAKAEGRTFDASVACPAGDFLSYLFK